MACDLFIRTYWKDFAWLEPCLQAIDRFCSGFRDVVVVVPRSSEAWRARRPGLGSGVRWHTCDDYPDDYLGQQVTKLHADCFTDADYVCHVDADCIFACPTTPDDLMVDGRPRVAMRRYDALPRHWPWRVPTEQFLGWSVSHDYMQRPPFTYPRWLYPQVREHARVQHGTELARWVTTRPPRGFSEFNVLGAFARAHHPDRFAFVEVDEHAPPGPCRWFWSWGGLDAATRRELAVLLGAPPEAR